MPSALLYTLVYVSSAVKPFTEVELLHLLEKSRVSNEMHAITGLLLYRDGNFMQALEGSKAAVMQLYSNIKRDPSHQNIITVVEENIESRNFHMWSMGFANIAAKNKNIKGFSGFSALGSLREDRDRNSVAPHLLGSFLKSFSHGLSD